MVFHLLLVSFIHINRKIINELRLQFYKKYYRNIIGKRISFIEIQNNTVHIKLIYGTELWYQNGKLHNDDGPALIYCETKKWYQNGKLHRDNGPAIILADGTQYWFQNGELHNDNGPAVILVDGTQKWYQNGQLHNNNGPAVIYINGTQEWYQNGKIHREIEPAIINAGGYLIWYNKGLYVKKTTEPTLIWNKGVLKQYYKGKESEQISLSLN